MGIYKGSQELHHFCCKRRDWDKLEWIYYMEECLWWHWEGSSESCSTSLEVLNLKVIVWEVCLVSSPSCSSFLWSPLAQQKCRAWSNGLFLHTVTGLSLFSFSLPMRHKVIRAVCDVELELVQLTLRSSPCPCTHVFEPFKSTFAWLR